MMIFAYFYPHRVQAYVCLSLRRRCYNIGAKEKYTFKRETTATKAEEKWIFQAKINLHQSTRIDRCRHVWKGQLKYKKKTVREPPCFLFFFCIFFVSFRNMRCWAVASCAFLLILLAACVDQKENQTKQKKTTPPILPACFSLDFFFSVGAVLVFFQTLIRIEPLQWCTSLSTCRGVFPPPLPLYTWFTSLSLSIRLLTEDSSYAAQFERFPSAPADYWAPW